MVENGQNGGVPLRWLKGSGFYVVHVLIGTIAVLLAAALLVAILEHIINPAVADKSFFGPPCVAQITLGFVMGFFVNRYLLSKSAKWTWVPYAVLLLLFFPDYVKSENGWRGAVSYLFGTNCNDCMEQIITAGVLYGSITYSLGAWVATKSRSTKAKSI